MNPRSIVQIAGWLITASFASTPAFPEVLETMNPDPPTGTTKDKAKLKPLWDLIGSPESMKDEYVQKLMSAKKAKGDDELDWRVPYRYRHCATPLEWSDEAAEHAMRLSSCFKDDCDLNVPWRMTYLRYSIAQSKREDGSVPEGGNVATVSKLLGGAGPFWYDQAHLMPGFDHPDSLEWPKLEKQGEPMGQRVWFVKLIWQAAIEIGCAMADNPEAAGVKKAEGGKDLFIAQVTCVIAAPQVAPGLTYSGLGNKYPNHSTNLRAYKNPEVHHECEAFHREVTLEETWPTKEKGWFGAINLLRKSTCANEVQFYNEYDKEYQALVDCFKNKNAKAQELAEKCKMELDALKRPNPSVENQKFRRMFPFWYHASCPKENSLYGCPLLSLGEGTRAMQMIMKFAEYQASFDYPEGLPRPTKALFEKRYNAVSEDEAKGDQSLRQYVSLIWDTATKFQCKRLTETYPDSKYVQNEWTVCGIQTDGEYDLPAYQDEDWKARVWKCTP